MRALITAALVTATLAGCAVSNTQQGQRSLRAQQTLDRYLTGRTAGAPQSCLPRYRSEDMIVVDDNTILFRDGSNRIWRNDPAGGCSGLGLGLSQESSGLALGFGDELPALLIPTGLQRLPLFLVACDGCNELRLGLVPRPLNLAEPVTETPHFRSELTALLRQSR